MMVSRYLFCSYLSMGKMWPQLRTPLALAILQEGDKLIMHYGSFNLNELELSDNQVQMLVETAIREHKKYNLQTKYLTLESMTLEWEKSLKAANTLVDSFEQQITSRSAHSRVNFLRHKSSSEFFEVIERNIFLLKQDKNSAKKFRESFASVNGKEVRCTLVAKMRDKLLAVRGDQQTEFHQLAALGLEKRNFNMESNIGE
ncbi:conserved hypothetical protein [Vibrio crassostreae]|nr:conserved hypothetical protein [Vibrio crassostreae]